MLSALLFLVGFIIGIIVVPNLQRLSNHWICGLRWNKSRSYSVKGAGIDQLVIPDSGETLPSFSAFDSTMVLVKSLIVFLLL